MKLAEEEFVVQALAFLGICIFSIAGFVELVQESLEVFVCVFLLVSRQTLISKLASAVGIRR